MGRIVGLDYGERRLGFAISDPSGTIALPLRVVTVCSDEEAITEVTDLCEETRAEKLVVGFPLSMNGQRGAMARKVEAFIENLSHFLTIPVEKWDERLSTCRAERSLLEADLSRQRRKTIRDKLAAQVILQGYLDSQEFSRTRGNVS